MIQQRRNIFVMMMLLLLFLLLDQTTGFGHRAHVQQGRPLLCKFRDMKNLTRAYHEYIRPTPRRELVMSVCHESLDWLRGEIHKFDSVVVYHKCGSYSQEQTKRLNVTVRSMENIGSCDGTYLHHILMNWESLANFTVFYKGTEEAACPPSYFIRPNHPPTECCPGNLLTSSRTRLNSFRMKKYKFSHNPDIDHKVYHQYFGLEGSLGSWWDFVMGPHFSTQMVDHSHATFCARGFFSASRESLHRHPKYLYAAFHSFQMYSMEEVDHYLERTWYSLINFPETINC